ILEASREASSRFVQVLGELLAAGLPTNSAFAARFAQRLQGKLPADNIVLQLLEQQLFEHGQSLAQLIHVDSQNQASDQVSMAGSVTSLRSIDSLDWKEFVEQQSV